MRNVWLLLPLAVGMLVVLAAMLYALTLAAASLDQPRLPVVLLRTRM